MLIQIDDNQRVRGTEMCWQTERRKVWKTGKKAGQEEWRPVKYHATLAQAMTEALQREIRLHPASTLTEQIEAAETLVAKYTEIFDLAVK